MPRGPRGIRVRGDGCVPCGVRGACASVLRRQSAGFRVMGLRRDGGRAAGLRQRLADRVRDEAVHGAAVAEAHLMLGGMDVDVHRGGIDVQEQHIGRLAVAMQHVGVGGAQRVADRAVAHETAVDVQVLPVGARAGRGRAGDHAGQAHRADGMRQQQAVLGELRAQHVADALRRIGGQPLALRAVVVEQAERDVRMRQRDAFHRVHAMPEFGGFRAQELAARRHRVEQLAHVHGGAGRARGGADLQAAAVDLPGVLAVARARDDGHLRDRGDGGQRLAAKSHRRHRFQFGQRADLAGGVARQRQRQFLGRNAAAIVGHGDAADAAAFQPHFDGARAGVDRVLQHFLEHGCRPLDDLAGRDLTDQQVGQREDGTAVGRGTGIGGGHGDDFSLRTAWAIVGDGFHYRMAGWRRCWIFSIWCCISTRP